METTRQREIRKERHVVGLARRSIRGAGTPSAVGRRLGRATSTVCHDGTDRMHPVLAAAYRLAMQIPSPETTLRPFVHAVRSLLEIREIVTADTPILTARARYLLDKEDDLNAAADKAARRSRATFTDALRAQATASEELADILDELDYRGAPLAIGGAA